MDSADRMHPILRLFLRIEEELTECIVFKCRYPSVREFGVFIHPDPKLLHDLAEITRVLEQFVEVEKLPAVLNRLLAHANEDPIEFIRAERVQVSPSEFKMCLRPTRACTRLTGRMLLEAVAELLEDPGPARPAVSTRRKRPARS